MIIDELKKQALTAMKAKDSVATTILRLAQGEIQQSEARAGKTFSDEESAAVLKKLVKSNKETAEQTADADAKAILLFSRRSSRRNSMQRPWRQRSLRPPTRSKRRGMRGWRPGSR